MGILYRAGTLRKSMIGQARESGKATNLERERPDIQVVTEYEYNELGNRY